MNKQCRSKFKMLSLASDSTNQSDGVSSSIGPAVLARLILFDRFITRVDFHITNRIILVQRKASQCCDPAKNLLIKICYMVSLSRITISHARRRMLIHAAAAAAARLSWCVSACIPRFARASSNALSRDSAFLHANSGQNWLEIRQGSSVLSLL